MTLDDLVALLARYDDDAWVAIANRGLLRRARKDLETVHPVVVGPADAGAAVDAVEVAVGDRVVRFRATGPADATCTCSSPVTCQHVVAAGLWLATGGGAGGDALPAVDRPSAEPSPRAPDEPARVAAPADGAASAHPADPADLLHDELMAWDAATLTAHAGLAGYRWAHHHLDDADQPPELARGSYLAVTFPQGVTVRYLGGGPAGLVVDQRVPAVERYQVAAVLAWQRAHGRVLPPPPPRATERPATESSLSQHESRARLRAAAATLLRDAVAVGVSHLSPALHDRLVTAGVWAQGVEYHRLARVLRRLADQVDLLLVRSAHADDLALLDELARAYALVRALDAAAAAGKEPVGLVGRARSTYDLARTLDVVGLGGVPWRTGSGYHGLTSVFWCPSRARMLTWTDARPDTLAGFDPRARWRQPAPWPGLPTPAAAAGARLTLTHPQLSADGRLSGVESCTAAVTRLDGPSLRALLPVTTSWRDVAPLRPLSLTDPADPATWVVLAPAGAAPVAWDPTAQTLRWPLLDASGDVVALEVPWSRLHAHAIGRLEGLTQPPAPGTLVVARVRRRHGAVVGEPVSLVPPDTDGPAVDCLHFDDPSGAGRPSTLVRSLLAAGADDADGPTDDHDSPVALPAPLVALRSLVERHAQRGCSGVPRDDVWRALGAAHASLRAVGLTVFVEPDRDEDAAVLLLRSLYLTQQVEHLLGGEPAAVG